MNRTIILAAAALAACHGNNNQSVPPPPADCVLPAPIASALDGGQVLELGTHQAGDSVTFSVPPGTASVSILQQAVGNVPLQVVFKQGTGSLVTDNSVVPRFLYFPDGGVAYDDSLVIPTAADKTQDPSNTFVEFSGDTPVAASFTFPNTATSLAGGAGVTPGNWRFIVGDFAHECATEFACLDGGTDQDRYDIKVVVKPQAATAVLDVNFFIVGSNTTRTGVPFTAAVAPNDPTVQRMLETYKSLFSRAHITVRNTLFFDVSAADNAKYAHVVVNGDNSGQGPCDPVGQMFTLSAGSPQPAVNIFLVDDLLDTSAGATSQLVGLDSTIPGPATLAGTVHSGAAVSMADLFFNSAAECAAKQTPNLTCGADEVAYIAAHESGHFLGLFHTTESGGTLMDPLTDTGKCACTACGRPDQKSVCGNTDSSAPRLGADQCTGATALSGCAGGDNLMFWLLDAANSLGTLSAQQQQVMTLNPTVH